MSETYEILAVKYGAMTNRTRADNFLHPDDHAAPMPIDYFVFVLRNKNRTILIDTGFDHKEAAPRGRKIDLEPREALQRIGIDAENLDTCIVTHLHYDHAGTLDHFRRRAFTCRNPRWPTPPGAACAITPCAGLSRSTMSARW
jgi:glyoxylase-like metal-dependent hydrolase (beta-lactamase superfamily II)